MALGKASLCHMLSHPEVPTLRPRYTHTSSVVHWGHVKSHETSGNLRLIDTGDPYEKEGVAWQSEDVCSLPAQAHSEAVLAEGIADLSPLKATKSSLSSWMEVVLGGPLFSQVLPAPISPQLWVD